MIPPISPRQDRQCALCGVYESVLPDLERHHMTPRSLGGGETTLLCVRCHNATEGDNPLVVGRTQDYVYAMQGDKIVVKRWFPPADFDEGLFLQQLEAAPEFLREASVQFRYLSDAALLSVGKRLRDILSGAWYCLGILFQEVNLRTPWGDKKALLRRTAQEFDLSYATARKYIEALEVAETYGLVQELDYWTPDALLLMAKAKDPQKAIERWETLAIAGATPSLAQYKQDILREAGPLDSGPEYHACPDCGTRHIVGRGR